MDIMILVDMSDLELKAYALSTLCMTYDFSHGSNTDIKPIAKGKSILTSGLRTIILFQYS